MRAPAFTLNEVEARERSEGGLTPRDGVSKLDGLNGLDRGRNLDVERAMGQQKSRRLIPVLARGLVLGALCATAAFAQGAPPASAPPPHATDNGAALANIASEKASDVPDPEKLRRSSDALIRMRAVLKDALGKLEEARATRDVVKLNCVNEKLTQIKGLLRISEQSDVSLQEAVAKRETGTAEHEFTKVTIARQKVEQLRAEAEECIGQLAFRTDENLTVEVEEPDNLPNADPTRPPEPAQIVSRPPVASPTD